MAVKIRLKKFGRTHRPYFRLCAVDARAPRDGRVIEELGHYDPMLPETDARARLKGERIDYWLSVGAQPTEKAAVLIKKYGSSGTHVDAQQQALDRLSKSSKHPGSVHSAAKPARGRKTAPGTDAATTEEAAASSNETPAGG